MAKNIRRILPLRKTRVQNSFSFTALSGKMWESFLPLMVTVWWGLVIKKMSFCLGFLPNLHDHSIYLLMLLTPLTCWMSGTTLFSISADKLLSTAELWVALQLLNYYQNTKKTPTSLPECLLWWFCKCSIYNFAFFNVLVFAMPQMQRNSHSRSSQERKNKFKSRLWKLLRYLKIIQCQSKLSKY